MPTNTTATKVKKNKKPRGNWRVRECADRIESLLWSREDAGSNSDQINLTDALADLRHYAYRYHLDFDDAVSMSENHANVEQTPSFREGR